MILITLLVNIYCEILVFHKFGVRPLVGKSWPVSQMFDTPVLINSDSGTEGCMNKGEHKQRKAKQGQSMSCLELHSLAQ